jgi:eukaryotic-like serine/threonine-protein kinase
MIGRQFGPYAISEKLGEGGMGEVYRARDTRLDRHVAIKVLHAQSSADPELRSRFEREGRTISQLNHPHICTLYDVGVDGDRQYLVMEFLDGETLADRIASRGALPIEEAVATALEIAAALEAAHRLGIIHRDLKPGNVFLVHTPGERAHVKLLDFGLAKLRTPAVDGSLAPTLAVAGTEVGLVVGTVAYMSPEQAEGLPADARTDLFSLGAVLYEMLSGRRPFEGPSSAATLASVLRDDPPPVGRLCSGVPPELERTVARLLAKDMRSRFASAAEVMQALKAVAGRVPPGGAAAAPSRPAPPSIAVLPFANLSPDSDNAYFAEGLAEEIIADLSAIRTLRVISRTSAMRFRAADRGLRSIAGELGVRYLLQGSVRRAGSTLPCSR